VPEGDYLRLQHWGAELYVCLAEGEHRIDADALPPVRHRRAQITGAAALLGLTAGPTGSSPTWTKAGTSSAKPTTAAGHSSSAPCRSCDLDGSHATEPAPTHPLPPHEDEGVLPVD